MQETPSSILGLERSPGEGIGYSPQVFLGFLGGSNDKESACNAGDLVLIPGWGRAPGGGHNNPLQYSCVENPMDRGAWWAAVYGVSKIWTQLSTWHIYKTDNQQRPLCSTGNSTQYSAITYNGKPPKKKKYIYM